MGDRRVYLFKGNFVHLSLYRQFRSIAQKHSNNTHSLAKTSFLTKRFFCLKYFLQMKSKYFFFITFQNGLFTTITFKVTIFFK